MELVKEQFFRKSTVLGRSAIHVAAFVLILFSISSHACQTDQDCIYGKCDTVRRICICNLPCDSFERRLVCTSEVKKPVTECTALNMACEFQRNFSVVAFNGTLFKRHKGNCKKIATESTITFCTDQTYCSGKGICFHRKGLSEQYCRCTRSYSGERCSIRKPTVLESSNSEGQLEKTGSNSTPFIALGILALGIVLCLVFFLQRRIRRSFKLQHETRRSSTEKINHERVVAGTFPGTEAQCGQNSCKWVKEIDSQRQDVVAERSRIELSNSKPAEGNFDESPPISQCNRNDILIIGIES